MKPVSIRLLAAASLLALATADARAQSSEAPIIPRIPGQEEDVRTQAAPEELEKTDSGASGGSDMSDTGTATSDDATAATAGAEQDEIEIPPPPGGGEEITETAPEAVDEAVKEEGLSASGGEPGSMEATPDAATSGTAEPMDTDSTADTATDTGTSTGAASGTTILLPDPLPGSENLAASAPTVSGADGTATDTATDNEEAAAETPAAPSAGTGVTTTQTAPAADSAPTAEAATPAPAAGASQHTVAAGDTLWDIARERYGDGSKWRLIEAANPGLRSGGLQIGTTLTLPEE